MSKDYEVVRNLTVEEARRRRMNAKDQQETVDKGFIDSLKARQDYVMNGLFPHPIPKRVKVPNSIRVGDNKNATAQVFLDIHGCKKCLWLGNKNCPFFPDVNIKKFHSNKICGHKISFVRELRINVFGENKGLTYAKEGLFKQAMDSEWIALHYDREALNTEDDDVKDRKFNMALQQKKFSADTNLRILKHIEGSKVEVSNVIDKMRNIVDVTPEEIEQIDEDKI